MHHNENKKANRLAQEKSPYLLQHTYNPVDWYPWDEEAFEKAKNEVKPIFLSSVTALVTGATCDELNSFIYLIRKHLPSGNT
jgi:uncharacterized protein YyaL (SSP411 family)